jgi:glucose-6-phosphate 1-epimerase
VKKRSRGLNPPSGAEYARVTAPRWTRGDRNGLDVVELAAPASTCTIALHGAQVLAFVPRGDRDWLWVSDRAQFAAGKALRGGIPICFPWFGPHPQDRALPAHGFARTRAWRLAGVDEVDARRMRARLELAADAESARLFPHAFAARLAVTAGEALELAFEVENTGDAPFTFELALHTYFAVADAGAASVAGLEGCAYVDKVEGGARRRQGADPIRFAGEIDRVYESSGPVTLDDPTGTRAIRIEATGAGSTVVWNPGAAKARAIADMSPDGFRGFACVETGNVGDQRVTLPPGARHETSVRYQR